MSETTQNPGTHPARKGEQVQQPHSSAARDERGAVASESAPGGELVETHNGPAWDRQQFADEAIVAVGPRVEVKRDPAVQTQNPVLPSPAVQSTGNGGGKAQTSKKVAKRAAEFDRPAGRKKPALRGDVGTPQPGQARDQAMRGHIAEQQRRYERTEWYAAAVKAGFKNPAALDRFNRLAARFSDSIDPCKVPVCTECGGAEVELCQHFVVNAGVEMDQNEGDEVIFIPPQVNMRYRFDWVNKVRRMFTWPRFDSDANVNHYINGFDNECISDDYLWPELLAYIRLNFNTSYVVSGVDDRQARLCHAKKIALRFLDESKIPLIERNSAIFVNRFLHTIQRACDQKDDEMLLKVSNPKWNFWVAPSDLWSKRAALVTGLAIISPILARKLVIAALRVHLFTFSRLAQANAEILGHGSVHALRCALALLGKIVTVLASGIWNGLAQPCCTAILRLLCKIVPTTFMKAFINGISRTLLRFRELILTGNLSDVLWAIWLRGYVPN